MEHKKIAIYALTEAGSETAAKLAEKLADSRLFIPARFKSDAEAVYFNTGEFTGLLEENWAEFDAHIFIMATGIVVRKISGMLKDKTVDPAVVVCDEKGKFVISLLSGHIGGANRLTEEVAGILGGQAVITTATDVQGIMAFDELAAIHGWQIRNPENIKVLNSLLLANKPIGVRIPDEIYQQYYGERKNILLTSAEEELESGKFCGAVIYGTDSIDTDCPVLYLD